MSVCMVGASKRGSTRAGGPPESVRSGGGGFTFWPNEPIKVSVRSGPHATITVALAASTAEGAVDASFSAGEDGGPRLPGRMRCFVYGAPARR
jgi:hypothetical protein